MKWIGRSLVERAAATTLPPTCVDVVLRGLQDHRSTLRRDRAVELNGVTEKFQQLLRTRSHDTGLLICKQFSKRSRAQRELTGVTS